MEVEHLKFYKGISDIMDTISDKFSELLGDDIAFVYGHLFSF